MYIEITSPTGGRVFVKADLIASVTTGKTLKGEDAIVTTTTGQTYTVTVENEKNSLARLIGMRA
jgi:hypothetical protein